MTDRTANVRVNVSGNATQQLEAMRQKARALGVEFDKAGKARVGGKFISNAELANIVAAGRHVREMAANAAKIGPSVARARGPFDAIVRAARSVGAALESANESIGDIDKRLNKTFGNIPGLSSLSSVGGIVSAALIPAQVAMAGIAVATTAFAAGMVASVQEASELESSMSRVRAATAGSRSEMMRLTSEASRLGAATQYSASQVAAVQENYAKAGFSVSQIVDATPSTLSFAAATDTDTGFASGLLASTIRSMGFQAGQSGDVADSLVIGSQASNVDVTDLGEAMKYAAPIFRSMGRDQQTTSFRDMIGLAGILGDQGIRGSQAGTALRSGYSRISSDRGAQRELRSLRVNTVGDDGNVRRMPEILADLRTALQGKSTGEQSASMNRIFGLNSASAFSAILGADPSRFAELTAQLENSGGAAERTARIMQDNLNGDLEQLGGAFGGLGTTIGNQLLPDSRTAVGAITDFVGALNAAFGAAENGKGPFSSLGEAIASVTDSVISLLVDVVPKIAGAMEAFGLLESGEAAKISERFAGGLVDLRAERAGTLAQRERDQVAQEERSRAVGLSTIQANLGDAQGQTGQALALDLRARLRDRGLEDLAANPTVAAQFASIESAGALTDDRRRELLGGLSSSLSPVIANEQDANRISSSEQRSRIDSAEQRARTAILATRGNAVSAARSDASAGQGIGSGLGMTLDAALMGIPVLGPQLAALRGISQHTGGGATESAPRSADQQSAQTLNNMLAELRRISGNTTPTGTPEPEGR